MLEHVLEHVLADVPEQGSDRPLEPTRWSASSSRFHAPRCPSLCPSAPRPRPARAPPRHASTPAPSRKSRPGQGLPTRPRDEPKRARRAATVFSTPPLSIPSRVGPAQSRSGARRRGATTATTSRGAAPAPQSARATRRSSYAGPPKIVHPVKPRVLDAWALLEDRTVSWSSWRDSFGAPCACRCWDARHQSLPLDPPATRETAGVEAVGPRVDEAPAAALTRGLIHQRQRSISHVLPPSHPSFASASGALARAR